MFMSLVRPGIAFMACAKASLEGARMVTLLIVVKALMTG